MRLRSKQPLAKWKPSELARTAEALASCERPYQQPLLQLLHAAAAAAHVQRREPWHLCAALAAAARGGAWESSAYDSAASALTHALRAASRAHAAAAQEVSGGRFGAHCCLLRGMLL